jgi:hypothetical protein
VNHRHTNVSNFTMLNCIRFQMGSLSNSDMYSFMVLGVGNLNKLHLTNEGMQTDDLPIYH